MENIIVSNQRELDEKLKKIKRDDIDKFHVLSDFDKTLTRAFVDGKETPSIISELRSGYYISKEYSNKATELANKYKPIENDYMIPFGKRKEAMKEWWEKHFELLIKCGLNIKHLKEITASKRMQLRDETYDFLSFLKDKKIPLVILSSAGLGTDSINLFLGSNKCLYDNIYVVSNEYSWDENGNAKKIKKPIIHVFNKDETVLKEYSFYDEIKSRKNVLLLGDRIEDLKMIEGFKYKTLISIGFLNEKVQENFEDYKKNFDVVILNDGSMDYVDSLLRRSFS